MERVIQFGEGGFLRGFVDWMLEKMKNEGLFSGEVVVVQPIENGLCDLLENEEKETDKKPSSSKDTDTKDSDDDEDDDGGCGSVISGAAIALATVIALGAGLVIKKKED